MSETVGSNTRAQLSGGRYTLGEKLGEGGMGEVFRAWDKHLETDVVIKLPRPFGDATGPFIQRFIREIRSLVKLAHPHVVGILDVGEHRGLPFAVLHYLSGGSLKDRRPRDVFGGAIPQPATTLRGWIAEVAAALDFVHAQGFIHRDVKPANILFDAHGNVYLSDFGIAKVLAAMAAENLDASLTGPNGMIGTPEYMAPELLAGQPYDGRVDQYALAVTVYEVLAGKGPFAGLSLPAIVVRMGTNQFPNLHEANPQVPKAVAAVVRRAMATDPADRYPTCAAFAQALLAACPGAGAPAPVRHPNKVPCPGCHKSIRYPSEMAGAHARCPGCQTPFVLPPAGTQLRPMPMDLPEPEPAPAKDDYQLPCPACRARVSTPATARGHRVVCGGCRKEFTLARDGRHLIPAPPVAGETRATASGTTDPLPRRKPRPPAGPPSRSKVPLVAAIAVLFVVAVGLGAYKFWPRGETPPTPNGGGGGETAGLVTRDDVVTGTISIDFKTRSRTGPEDVYTVNLAVRTEDEMQVVYAGTIYRRPPPAKEGASGKDAPTTGLLRFDLSVKSQQLTRTGQVVPGKERQLGKITGRVPQSTDGLYSFGELAWTNDLGETTLFGGKVQGKSGDGRTKKAVEVAVFVDGELLKYTIADPDPMKFRSLTVPEDRALGLPSAEWGGELTFDYDKGSYLPNALACESGKLSDRVVGIVGWEKHPTDYLRAFKLKDDAVNAKSQYLFNLVFASGAAGEGKGGRVGKDQEKKLTVADKSKSALTGSIDYSDDGPVVESGGELAVTPYKSRLTFHLHANRLTPRQVHSFLRMWLLMSGPVNDE